MSRKQIRKQAKMIQSQLIRDSEGNISASERKRLRRLRSATGVAYPTGYFFFRGAIWLVSQLFIKVGVHGQDNIPSNGGRSGDIMYRPHWYRRRGNSKIDDNAFVLAANHGSVWDISALGVFRRPFVWVCKPWFVANPILGQINQRMGALSVFRRKIDGDLSVNAQLKVKKLQSVAYTPSEMFDVASRAIKRGIPAIMFPEGTRLDSSSVGDAYMGAAILANRTGVPILPVALAGCAKEDVEVRTWFLRRRVIVMCIGAPIYPPTPTSAVSTNEVCAAMIAEWQRVMEQELLPRAHAIRDAYASR